VLLAPLQILWINLVTDTLPALSLAVEPSDDDVRVRPPRPPSARILDWRDFRRTGGYALLMTGASVLALLVVARWDDPARAPVAAFITISLAQLLHLGTARSSAHVLQVARAVSNRMAIGAVLAGTALTAAAVSLPPLARTLHLTAPSVFVWLVSVLCAGAAAVAGQLHLIYRARSHAAPGT
jgi:Ca2+-transporting ATPase